MPAPTTKPLQHQMSPAAALLEAQKNQAGLLVETDLSELPLDDVKSEDDVFLCVNRRTLLGLTPGRSVMMEGKVTHEDGHTLDDQSTGILIVRNKEDASLVRQMIASSHRMAETIIDITDRVEKAKVQKKTKLAAAQAAMREEKERAKLAHQEEVKTAAQELFDQELDGRLSEDREQARGLQEQIGELMRANKKLLEELNKKPAKFGPKTKT